MAELFLKVVNISIAASWVVLAVVILRLFLKKAPKWIFCLLWALVAVRLLCPVSIESEFSLVPESGTVVSKWTDDYIGDTWLIHEDSIYYDAAVAAGREPIPDGEGGYAVIMSWPLTTSLENRPQ